MSLKKKPSTTYSDEESNPALKNDEPDEEYARKLQEALNAETQDTPTTTEYYKPQLTTTSPTSVPLNPTGTYALSPLGTSFSPSDSGLRTSDFVLHAETQNEDNRSLSLKRQSFTIKIFCIIDFVFSLYAVAFRAWWLSFGIVFAPIGGFAAHKFNKPLTLVYLIYLVANVVLELAFTFLNKDLYVIIFSVLVVAIQLFIVYFVLTFFRAIPATVATRSQEAPFELQE